ncbi:MAG: hypothetical protein JOZ96_26445 [Acidobacteria bacterium]|nr:hypothetical protein [Acidobacteriota bacterium]
MESSTFTDHWRSNFPDCPPVSYLFKWRLPDRWFRFHSLPESRRYAESDAERAELLTRQNTVLLDGIGEGERCVLVAGDYSESPGTLINGSSCPVLAEHITHALPSLSKQEFDPEPSGAGESPIYMRLACGSHTLRRGTLDEILLCAADERVTNFFVVSFERGRIFAPYGGGVDVVLRDASERDEFRARYAQWLSARPDGL